MGPYFALYESVVGPEPTCRDVRLSAVVARSNLGQCERVAGPINKVYWCRLFARAHIKWAAKGFFHRLRIRALQQALLGCINSYDDA